MTDKLIPCPVIQATIYRSLKHFFFIDIFLSLAELEIAHSGWPNQRTKNSPLISYAWPKAIRLYISELDEYNRHVRLAIAIAGTQIIKEKRKLSLRLFCRFLLIFSLRVFPYRIKLTISVSQNLYALRIHYSLCYVRLLDTFRISQSMHPLLNT